MLRRHQQAPKHKSHRPTKAQIAANQGSSATSGGGTHTTRVDMPSEKVKPQMALEPKWYKCHLVTPPPTKNMTGSLLLTHFVFQTIKTETYIQMLLGLETCKSHKMEFFVDHQHKSQSQWPARSTRREG